jgi:hypothetical protein
MLPGQRRFVGLRTMQYFVTNISDLHTLCVMLYFRLSNMYTD